MIKDDGVELVVGPSGPAERWQKGTASSAGCGAVRGETQFLRAFSPGDVIIGGLFPIHLQTNRTTDPGPVSCSHYDLRSFLHSQVMIYAIRDINEHTPRVLPNITLGYDIYDTCGDPTLAIRATLQLLKGQSGLLPPDIQSPLPEPLTKAVIGERYSEVSIAVARVLALSSVAQISYASTSELLSRKLKFPTFLRTISSDEYQTKAIAELVKQFNWKTVAIIGSDDEYGKYGSDRLVYNFREMKDVCIEFIEILPGYFSKSKSKTHTKLSALVSSINASSAEAVIMFTKGVYVDLIMEAAVNHKLNRTWIASDSWSTSSSTSSMPGIKLAGRVFGFNSKRNEVPGFKDYVFSLFNGSNDGILKHHLTHYPLCSERSRGDNCLLPGDQPGAQGCLGLSCLADNIDRDTSYNIYLAVQVVVEGLRHLLKCDSQRCEQSDQFSTLELLAEIRRVNFTVNNTNIYFDDNGDPSLGYDVVYWDMTSEQTHIETIGEYWPNGKIKLPDDLVIEMRKVMITAYNCSKTCKPGEELKKKKDQCCNDCVPCADGEFSPGKGVECRRCSKSEYSSPEKDKCLSKRIVFQTWSDPFVVIMNFLQALGIIMTIGFAILFMIHLNTPIVKSVGGYLCFLELLSLLACFCLTFSFPGKPTAESCMVGLPLFGIAFSLCISCILANLLQIFVGFMFNPKVKSWLKKLNRPLAVVVVVSGIQLALCVPWLYLYPPLPERKVLSTTILLQCDKGSSAFFIAMLGYNAFLALLCFLFAFKGKQLPDLYKNASLIAISMLLFLIIWILFIPIYMSLFGRHKQAIESTAILISSYSILCTHLAPKCYIIVFKKEINNESAITEYIRKHYEQKGIAVVKA
ncbi:G-protein coupled receptor family C group 6 member A-like [Aulostomus maculatus]